MLLPLLRIAYVALLVGMAVLSFSFLVESPQPALKYGVPVGILVVGAAVLYTDMIEKHKQITTISAVYFGLLLGLLLGYLFSIPLANFASLSLMSNFPSR